MSWGTGGIQFTVVLCSAVPDSVGTFSILQFSEEHHSVVQFISVQCISAV